MRETSDSAVNALLDELRTELAAAAAKEPERVQQLGPIDPVTLKKKVHAFSNVRALQARVRAIVVGIEMIEKMKLQDLEPSHLWVKLESVKTAIPSGAEMEGI